ncbi:sulfatase-like hydrolase/transferase [Algibacter amylolyticus]|uniref:Sulfatase-like hydrolase/transferase n=1 Tax=Algibacter amylolyticus TaxID=1608400 RepID=A0A5M7B2X4_9FLAO|nr:sulfatase-like hydrolase/transferase [Algibacter amylolyticus]KAA5823782.1 sulfatase-like hydrolase/transferase [Algibacter amylolyticus]MBB5267955.1 arylsulfatase A-like enzyme [Algibacter amylolyticus]TSJ74270.1 sulfatase-like hydrolase/transferase [Algibacter amylolyticus]
MKIKICFLFLIVAISSCNKKVEKEAFKVKPNIVFIFTDDQTYSSIHALGNNEIITPTMDLLVKEGTTFTNAYNMGAWSGAVCAASRAMLISGRSVWNVNNFRKNWIKKDSLNKTWGKLLETNGYDTYMTGKWHVDAPANQVFQHTKHVRPGMPKDTWDHWEMVAKFDSLSKTKNPDYEAIMPNGYNRPKSINDTTWSSFDTSKGGFWEGGKHWSEVLKDDAISFIDEAKTKDNPFFMYLAFNAPHDPRQAPKEYFDMYNLDSISLPESYLLKYPFNEDIASGINVRDEALAPFPRTELAVKTHTKEYYASITHVDAQIGKIIEVLKASGKMDNTYIIFTADHGLAMGRHGLIGKQSLFDHSIRPPMIILGPDIPKNKKTNVDVYLQDAMATSLDIAGVEKPKYIEFNTFLDIAKGAKKTSNYHAIYGAYKDAQRMIRKDGYKLLVYPKIEKVLLFDLKKDPEEIHDISKNPEQRERVKTLFNQLLKLQKDMDDPLDISALNKTL